jgi:hypothetical protein
MAREAIIRFHTDGAGNAIAKVRAALEGAGLTVEPPGGSAGAGGGVVVAIFKASWDAADKAALCAALEQQGLPGTYEVIGASEHGYA